MAYVTISGRLHGDKWLCSERRSHDVGKGFTRVNDTVVGIKKRLSLPGHVLCRTDGGWPVLNDKRNETTVAEDLIRLRDKVS